MTSSGRSDAAKNQEDILSPGIRALPHAKINNQLNLATIFFLALVFIPNKVCSNWILT